MAEYDHSRKAGNRGDVWKHAALVALADAILVLSDTCRYVDFHSGAPAHVLRPGGEWGRGIGDARLAAAANPYLAMAAAWVRSGQYPAGWVFVVDRLAKRFPQVRVELSDLSDSVAVCYGPTRFRGIPSNVDITFVQTDGFAVAAGVERAALLLLDPPFYPDAEADWHRWERSADCSRTGAFLSSIGTRSSTHRRPKNWWTRPGGRVGKCHG
jgi:23S rRNA A2030 N6-methylase RlmJ